MKKKNFVWRTISVIFACILLLSILSLNVFAADDPAEGGDSGAVDTTDAGDSPGTDENPPQETTPPDDAADDPDSNSQTDEEPDAGNVTPTEPEEDDDEDDGETTDDAQSAYVEPTHLSELPTVKEGDVITATALPVPKAEVSDASLLSGIIMWLCVAVGIAVVVGVMVSRRTRRRGG